MRQVHGGLDGGIGNPHMVMLFHRVEQPTQHHAAGLDVGLVDLARRAIPSQPVGSDFQNEA
jgi:hypothetical protein